MIPLRYSIANCSCFSDLNESVIIWVMKIFKSLTAEVAELLKNGAVGIIPTDTVYGIVTQLSNQAGVERIYDIKNRPYEKRIGTVLFSDPVQVEAIVQPRDLLMAEIYWPGPTSVVFEIGTKLSYAHRGHKTLAFRIPDNQSLLSLLQKTGPLATTSANRANQPTATTIEEALGVFRESVDFYVDGGDLSNKKPSSIVEIKSDGTIETIR